MKPVVEYCAYQYILLRVPIYVTTSFLFNENTVGRKICQIAIRRPAWGTRLWGHRSSRRCAGFFLFLLNEALFPSLFRSRLRTLMAERACSAGMAPCHLVKPCTRSALAEIVQLSPDWPAWRVRASFMLRALTAVRIAEVILLLPGMFNTTV